MAIKMKRLTVYIGRFSPFHKGHAETIELALRNSDRVLIIIGSSHKPRDIKNPWTFAERALMIRNWYDTLPDFSRNKTECSGRKTELVIVPQQDHPYSNQRWLAEIQQLVTDNAYRGSMDVHLTGSDRDDSTFYLKEFPNYKLDLVTEDREISQYLSATSIRDIYLGGCLNKRRLTIKEAEELNRVFVPETTAKFLSEFRKTTDFDTLVKEYQFQYEHDRRWAAAPHVPTFQTVDAVVIQTGHILLVKRRNAPGKGLWALPGGYLNQQEWMLDGAVRELIEETKIDVPKPVIYGSLKDDHIFEAPNRSNRGRVITRAFLFKLPDFVVDGKITLPKVKGEDDAEKAKWFPLSEVFQMSDVLFEDHYDIIEVMLGRAPR
jgi:bifunctional NMN adenylyltransferase/nudix hydrolase